VKKFLVIQTASIGDVILATPVVEKLHNFFPGAAIDFLLKKGNEGIFKDHPYLYRVISWDKSKGKYKNLYGLIRSIRKNHYDFVINIQRFASTGIITVFSGAPVTIGFDKNPLSRFFTHTIKHRIGRGIHEIRRNLELVEEFTDKSVIRPRIYPSPADFGKVSSLKSVRYYTISPASLYFTKQFPGQKWSELIRSIPVSDKVYLLGSSMDREACAEIARRSAHPGVINLAGEFSLLESAALMRGAKMNFTNDSAPMHLASAMNAPVTVVYCSTVPEFGFGPVSEDSFIVETSEELDCRPCGLHGFQKCPKEHFKCALTITTDPLIARL
jgi:ADP-heptose:LPS heptosyltransferase